MAAASFHIDAARSASATRLRALVPTLAIHALLALLLLTQIDGSTLSDAPTILRIVPPTQDEPPPPAPQKLEFAHAEPLESAEEAPPALKADPAPFVAPEPETILPPPTPPPPAAPVAGTGSAPTAGAAATPGPGTGAGGFGNGRGGGGNGAGGGGSGSGTGSGRAEIMPRLIRGDFSYSDIPPSLRERGFRGRVGLRFVIDVDGRAKQCRVARSSGSALMDQAACRALEQRFLFTPARDETGRPVPIAGEDNPEFEADES